MMKYIFWYDQIFIFFHHELWKILLCNSSISWDVIVLYWPRFGRRCRNNDLADTGACRRTWLEYNKSNQGKYRQSSVLYVGVFVQQINDMVQIAIVAILDIGNETCYRLLSWYIDPELINILMLRWLDEVHLYTVIKSCDRIVIYRNGGYAKVNNNI